MRKQFNKGVFLFNIIPRYRPGMSNVFDYGRQFGLTGVPSLLQRVKQNTLFRSLENPCGECLSEIDLFYVFATDGSDDFSLTNWKSPGYYQAIKVSSPIRTENEGWAGNGTSSYLNTGWDPATDGVNFSLNGGGVLCYIHNDISSANVAAYGCRGNAGGALNGQVLLFPDNVVNSHSFSINSLADNTGASVSGNGFYQTRRTATNDHRLFKNGSQVGTTDTTVTDSLSNKDIYIGAMNTNGSASFHSTCKIGMFGIGRAFATKEAAIYNAWNTYFMSL